MDDILHIKYPRTKSDAPTIDPDRGAAGDWQTLRSNLKGKTAEARSRKAKRPRAMPDAG